MPNIITEKIKISGAYVWPIIEGGKGIGLSDGLTAGSFAAADCVGTVSGVAATIVDDNGETIPYTFKTKDRAEKHEELVVQSIKGAETQAKIAHDVSGGRGRIHMNALWEMGGSKKIIRGVLERTKGIIHGVTCGAGMPYGLGELASEFSVYYYPIVSSMRAFRALWKRAYHKFEEFLGGVVYEDPWVAGGHNGLSNSENPEQPEDMWKRVLELREFMNNTGLSKIPIIAAGGVWNLSEWKDWINESAIKPIAFQFGTRPLLTKESPLSDEAKQLMLSKNKPFSVLLNKFSPTGFYSSAIKNRFLTNLEERSARQISFAKIATEALNCELVYNTRGNKVYVSSESANKAKQWVDQGFSRMVKTPDSCIVFVSPDELEDIRYNQINCVGCLSACRFSNWSENNEGHTTGNIPDPRSFCIRATLQRVASGVFDPNMELMFGGKNAVRFATDPLYKDGYIPSIAELVEQILKGN